MNGLDLRDPCFGLESLQNALFIFVFLIFCWEGKLKNIFPSENLLTVPKKLYLREISTGNFPLIDYSSLFPTDLQISYCHI